MVGLGLMEIIILAVLGAGLALVVFFVVRANASKE
jgi:hypothetical protein